MSNFTKIGDARTSTKEQVDCNQILKLKEHGIEVIFPMRVYQEVNLLAIDLNLGV